MRSLLYHTNSREGKSNFPFYSANDFHVHLTLLFFCLPWSAEYILLIAKICLQHWFWIYRKSLMKPDKIFTQILKIKQLDMTISWTQKTTKVQSFSQMGFWLELFIDIKMNINQQKLLPCSEWGFPGSHRLLSKARVTARDSSCTVPVLCSISSFFTSLCCLFSHF